MKLRDVSNISALVRTDREGFGTGVSQKTCQIDSMSKALVVRRLISVVFRLINFRKTVPTQGSLYRSGTRDFLVCHSGISGNERQTKVRR